MDTPLLVRRQEVERFFRVPLDFWPITSFTERVSIGGRKPAGFHRNHASIGDPDTVAEARERTPWDQLVNVGVTGVVKTCSSSRPDQVGLEIILRGCPEYRGSGSSRLLYSAPDAYGTTGKLAQGSPGFHGYLTVGSGASVRIISAASMAVFSIG